MILAARQALRAQNFSQQLKCQRQRLTNHFTAFVMSDLGIPTKWIWPLNARPPAFQASNRINLLTEPETSASLVLKSTMPPS